MDSKKVVLAAAVLLAVAAVPAVSSDSDGTVSDRLLSPYVSEATFTARGASHYYYEPRYAYMLDGSENHRAMLAFLEDPMNRDIPGDDRNVIPDSAGKTVHVYMPYKLERIYFEGQYGDAVLVWEKFDSGVNFLVDSHSEFNLKAESVTSWHAAPSVEIKYTENGIIKSKQLISGSEFSLTAGDGKTAVSIGTSEFYADIVYEADGYIVPSGSPAVFAAVCFVVALAVLGLVFAASRKPSWQK